MPNPRRALPMCKSRMVLPLNFIYVNPQDSLKKVSFYFYPHFKVEETERKFGKLIMGRSRFGPGWANGETVQRPKAQRPPRFWAPSLHNPFSETILFVFWVFFPLSVLQSLKGKSLDRVIFLNGFCPLKTKYFLLSLIRVSISSSHTEHTTLV